MDTVLVNAILATLVVSVMSLVGVVTFFLKKKLINKITIFLVAFSTGALIGGAFLHLLPEAVEISDGLNPFLYLILGISVFFVLERYLQWHHCHKQGDCAVHTYTYMSLIGDGVHNFIDGVIIVAAFAISPETGVATVIAVAAHEIPQELGDFGILIHGGFSKTRALMWNFASSITAVLGAVVGYLLINSFTEITAFLLPFAAGGFIYIAMSDLIPELHKELRLSKSIFNFGLFAVGILFMLLIKLFFAE